MAPLIDSFPVLTLVPGSSGPILSPASGLAARPRRLGRGRGIKQGRALERWGGRKYRGYFGATGPDERSDGGPVRFGVGTKVRAGMEVNGGGRAPRREVHPLPGWRANSRQAADREASAGGARLAGGGARWDQAPGAGVSVGGLCFGSEFHGQGRREGRGGRPPPDAPEGVGEGDGGLVDARHRRFAPQRLRDGGHDGQAIREPLGG